MRFEIDPAYVKAQSRRSLWVSFFFILIMAGCLAGATSNAKLSAYVIPVTAIVVLSHLVYAMHKTRREGANAYAVIYTSEDDRFLNVQFKDTIVTITLAEVRKVALQYRKDRLVSILLKAKSDQDVRIAGYRNMPALADILKSAIKPENIKVATWFHG
jgi:hypothetical protein